jgi:hypothetical protein
VDTSTGGRNSVPKALVRTGAVNKNAAAMVLGPLGLALHIHSAAELQQGRRAEQRFLQI